MKSLSNLHLCNKVDPNKLIYVVLDTAFLKMEFVAHGSRADFDVKHLASDFHLVCPRSNHWADDLLPIIDDLLFVEATTQLIDIEQAINYFA